MMDLHDINILDFIFLNLALSVTFTGFLINNFETHVPAFIIKAFRYGSFAYQGSGGNFLQVIEIPKSYYRHFYSFSSVLSFLSLIYMILVYHLSYDVHRYIPVILKVFLQQDKPSVSAQAAVVAMFLITVQCARRFYETYYMQVFAKSSKINLSHYLAGIVHYFGCIVATIGQAPLFCGEHNRENILWSDTRTMLFFIPGSLLFLWAWYEQYQSNIIFANLRKDKKSGRVITEEHGVPKGRLFEFVSSPHRMCEVIMYSVLVILIPTKTFFCIYLWVLANQIQTAIQAHQWYQKTFSNYPKNRFAVVPYFY